MNYWILYRLDNGSIHGSPYLGDTDEWTNIPDGCGVIGPIPQEDSKAKDASENPDWYTVQNDILVPVPDIDAKRAAKEAEKNKPKPPSKEDRIASLEEALMTLMGL